MNYITRIWIKSEREYWPPVDFRVVQDGSETYFDMLIPDVPGYLAARNHAMQKCQKLMNTPGSQFSFKISRPDGHMWNRTPTYVNENGVWKIA